MVGEPRRAAVSRRLTDRRLSASASLASARTAFEISANYPGLTDRFCLSAEYYDEVVRRSWRALRGHHP